MVSHLEEDQFVAGNILFSEYQALLTTDGQSQDVIVGQHGFWPIYDYQEGIGTNATFRTISSFAQLNRTHTLIADRDNGCIRSLNRLTNETSHFSGICEHLKGSPKPAIDGSRLNATFWKINSLTLYKTTLYIVESNSQRIRALDLADERVRTVITADNFTHSHHLPRVIVANWDTDILYVTTRYGIGQYDPSSDNFTYMVKSPQSGFRDGNLLESKWWYNDGMVLLPNNSLIVADVNNNRLRIVDLISNNVTTWCFRYPKAFQNCSITKPNALRLINCTLFISNSKLISTLRLPPWSCGTEIRNDWINIAADWIVNNQGTCNCIVIHSIFRLHFYFSDITSSSVHF